MKKIIFIILAIVIVSLTIIFYFVSKSNAVLILRTREGAAGTDYTDDANCQGAWLFADNLNDESGEGNTLTDGGSISYTTDRPTGFTTGKSIDCDGSTDQLYRLNADLSTNFPSKASKTNFSIAMWVLHDVSSADIWIEGYNSFRMQAESDDDIPAWIRDSDYDEATAYMTTDPTDLETGTWYHICFVFTGGTNSGKVWVSTTSFGNIEDEKSLTFTIIDNCRASGSENFSICSNYNGSAVWDGHIYQPIIFDDALSESECQDIYTDGITGED